MTCDTQRHCLAGLALAVSGLMPNLADGADGSQLTGARRQEFRQPTGSGSASGGISAIPDSPMAFGYKCLWFAVRAKDPTPVADAIGLIGRQPANWASGIAAGYGGADPLHSAAVYVSPEVHGWVFVVGLALPLPSGLDSNTQAVDDSFQRIFQALAHRFTEVQYFVTHRVGDVDGWARARHGAVERLFLFADGSVRVNIGTQTAEEAKLGFPDLSGLAPDQATRTLFDLSELSERDWGKANRPSRSALPDEKWTMDLAGAWGLDPTRLAELKAPLGVGILGRLAAAR